MSQLVNKAKTRDNKKPVQIKIPPEIRHRNAQQYVSKQTQQHIERKIHRDPVGVFLEQWESPDSTINGLHHIKRRNKKDQTITPTEEEKAWQSPTSTHDKSPSKPGTGGSLFKLTPGHHLPGEDRLHLGWDWAGCPLQPGRGQGQEIRAMPSRKKETAPMCIWQDCPGKRSYR